MELWIRREFGHAVKVSSLISDNDPYCGQREHWRGLSCVRNGVASGWFGHTNLVVETGPDDVSDGDDVTTSWTLIADQMAPWRARALTEPLVVDADATVRDDVLLLVSELITNAVEHGSRPGDPMLLNVSIARHVLRVTVTDRTVAPPVLRHVSADRVDGRGLWIVEQVADRWGVDVTDIGKSVWFEVRLGPTTGPTD